MRTLIIWHNLNYDTYYYKFINGTYRSYSVGDKNQYNHEVILVIEGKEVQPIIERHYFSIRKLVFSPIIWLLNKLTGFLQKITK